MKAKKDELRPSSFKSARLYLLGTPDKEGKIVPSYYFRPLHAQGINAVVRKDVALRLNDIRARSGAATASQARAILSAFFVWAIKEGIADGPNPVINTNCFETPSRDRVLSNDELKRIWNGCEDDTFGRCIKLLVLTGARRNEIAQLRWSEIDEDAGLINLPKERVKNGTAHSIPITPLMAKIIGPRQDGRQCVFGNRTDTGWTGFYHAQRLLDARIGQTEKWTPHDIRRSVATGMAELGIQPFAIEAILNHRSGGSRSSLSRVYNRSNYSREAKSALLVWNDHVASITSGDDRKVIPLKKRPRNARVVIQSKIA